MRFLWKSSRHVVATSFLLLTIIIWAGEAIGGQFKLTWVDAFTDQQGFSVERSTGTTGTFAEITTTGTGVTAYTDSTVADATTYCYRVRAFNAAGYSDYTNVACGTTPQIFGLAVVKMGTGSGTVTSSPAGITCGATCSGSYTSGTAVTLTAAPATDSTFTGWNGGGCSGTGSCTVTLTATTTVTATFDLQSVSLTVSQAGTGSGTVTSSPAGITCGATCSASYASGTAVTLTAASATDSGSTFTGWNGGGCSGTGSCTLTLTAPTTVTATFALSSPTTPCSPCSFWTTATVPVTPTDPDNSGVELGLRFTTDVAGNVTGLRFYKGPQNTGEHTGHLWSAAGSRLASVVFGSETASGWQTAFFAAPVAITAGATYVISYYAPNGYYADDVNFFAVPLDQPPLHAPVNAGVYRYGGGFPTDNWEASTYWVDVIFVPGP